MSEFTPVTASYRAWSEVTQANQKKHGKKSRNAEPSSLSDEMSDWLDETAETSGSDYVLAFDTETTIDALQNLTFGMYRWCINTGKQLLVLEEGVFYADDLSLSHPDGIETIRSYAAFTLSDAPPNPDYGVTGNEPIRFLSRSEFVETVFFRALQCDAMIVGFNLPFDLSRIAVGSSDGIGRNYGGFSFNLYDKDHPDASFRPNIRIRSLDSKKAFISVTRPSKGIAKADGTTRKVVQWVAPGRFLDLRTLSFALSNISYKLASACEAWGVSPKIHPEEHGLVTPEYIEYCRQDVRSTTELAFALIGHYNELKLTLPVEKVYSPASIAKASLKDMGIIPPLDRQPDFDRDILGVVMESFYGGRSEVKIRRQFLPVAEHDFTSMYPSVNTLMRLWRFLTCETVRVVDSTREVQSFLDNVTAESFYDPKTWLQLVGVARIIPDDDILPLRANYTDNAATSNIGLNYVTGNDPTYYTIADLAASKILNDKTPVIIKAYTFEPVGELSGLKSMDMGNASFDPYTSDFFQSVVEARNGLPDKRSREGERLKCLANSGAYGIFSEFVVEDEAESGPKTSVDIMTTKGGLIFRTHKPERPGTFCFPPIAACITGAAHLMLALLEKAVTDAGGTYVFVDTDSMAIVYDPESPDGRLIPCPGGQHVNDDGVACIKALSSSELESIRRRFNEEINPYDRKYVRNLLKRERVVESYAVSAKRYATFLWVTDNDGKRVPSAIKLRNLDKNAGPKEHGLGHILNPISDIDLADKAAGRPKQSWMDRLWIEVLQRELDESNYDDMWEGRPTLTRLGITSTHMLKQMRRFNEGQPWREQIKPFNFMLQASAGGEDYGQDEVSILTPYTTDLSDVASLPWLDKSTREPVSVTLPRDSEYRADEYGGTTYVVDTMGKVVSRHPLQQEFKFRDSTDVRCQSNSRGVLSRTHVLIVDRTWIGKEANDVEKQEQQYTTEQEELQVYKYTTLLDDALPILRSIPVRQITQRLSDEVSQLEAHIQKSKVRDYEQAFYINNIRGKAKRAAFIVRCEAEQAERLASVSKYRLSERHLLRILDGSATTRFVSDLLLTIAAEESTRSLNANGHAVELSLSPLTYGMVRDDDITHYHDNRLELIALWRLYGSAIVRPVCTCGCGRQRRQGSKYAEQSCAQRTRQAGINAPAAKTPIMLTLEPSTVPA